jgi:hypothetical protein
MFKCNLFGRFLPLYYAAYKSVLVFGLFLFFEIILKPVQSCGYFPAKLSLCSFQCVYFNILNCISSYINPFHGQILTGNPITVTPYIIIQD